MEKIEVYTDGSCHSQLKKGAWAALIFFGETNYVLSGKEENTSHNRMELLAVIKAIEFVADKNRDRLPVTVYSDSQYVVHLLERKNHLTRSEFLTRSREPVRNTDLIRQFFSLTEMNAVSFIKVKAHQKENQMNRKADMMARKLVRDWIREG